MSAESRTRAKACGRSAPHVSVEWSPSAARHNGLKLSIFKVKVRQDPGLNQHRATTIRNPTPPIPPKWGTQLGGGGGRGGVKIEKIIGGSVCLPK